MHRGLQRALTDRDALAPEFTPDADVAHLPRQRHAQPRHAGIWRARRRAASPTGGSRSAAWSRGRCRSSLADLRALPSARPDHPPRLRRGLERDRQVERAAARHASCKAAGMRDAARYIVFTCADLLRRRALLRIDRPDRCLPPADDPRLGDERPRCSTSRTARRCGCASSASSATSMPNTSCASTRSPASPASAAARAAIGRITSTTIGMPASDPGCCGAEDGWLAAAHGPDRPVPRPRGQARANSPSPTPTAPSAQLRHARSGLSRRRDPLHRQGARQFDRPPSRARRGGGVSWTAGWSIEQGDIRDLVELLNAQHALGVGQRRAQARPGRSSALSNGAAPRRPHQHGAPRRSATSRIITICRDRLYDLFLDADRQYSCAYFTDPANSLEQAQDDKKAHIAAKLALAAGHEGARHRLRLGRHGALSRTPRPAPRCSASPCPRNSSRSPAGAPPRRASRTRSSSS